MFCRNCGTQIADDAKFCDACGTQTAAEQANILARQEKNRQDNPPEYADIKTTVITMIALFVILPAVCWLEDAPIVIGFATAGVMGAFFLYFGIRNERKNKNRK